MLLEIGENRRALDNLRKTLEMDHSLAAADPSNVQARADLAINYSRIGEALMGAGSMESALENYREALSIREALSRKNPEN